MNAAEMCEAAAAAYDSVADPLLNEPCAFKRACFRAGWDAGRRAIPSDEEMVERVADREAVFEAAQAYRHQPLHNPEETIAAYRALIRVVIRALSEEKP